MNKLDAVVAEVAAELKWATKKFPPFNSAHEGYAVILEELDELWEKIMANKHTSPVDRAQEALQVAAMALRYVQDLTTPEQFSQLQSNQKVAGR